MEKAGVIFKVTEPIALLVCNFIQGEEELCLHADDCVGQNKNNTTVWYLAWRVTIGLSKACELSFTIPGHTRFSSDCFFEGSSGDLKFHHFPKSWKW